MKAIDAFLNRTTMYRLVILFLGGLVGLAAVLGSVGLLPYDPFKIVSSAIILLFTCWLTNRIFGWAFDAPAHGSSAYITALILTLIVPPAATAADLPFLIWVGVIAMAAKFILAWRRQHVFNPAALAVAITAIALFRSANWWVGSKPLLPAVLIGGWLVMRKLQRSDVVTAFLVSTAATIAAFTLAQHGAIGTQLLRALTTSPLVFFATIMLTEPFTMPATRGRRIAFGVFVGVLFAPPFHLGGLYLTPELALLAGNLGFYLLRPRLRYRLTLVSKRALGPDTYEFAFRPDRPLAFAPGQYVELAVPHGRADSRGERRFFTVPSSPTDTLVRFGVKFQNPASSYKLRLWNLPIGGTLVAAQVDGDFTLPKNPKQPLVFIAGGIGITPFRSMVAYLKDTGARRPVTLLYSARSPGDLAYRGFFDRAASVLGLHTVYTVTDPAPKDWDGQRGYLDPKMIVAAVPQYQRSRFYLSGPRSMVLHFQSVLADMGVPRRSIRTDYFPGFA